MNKRVMWIGRLIFWPLLLWLVFVVVQNPAGVRYSISDWLVLRNYEPSEQIEAMAEHAQMTDHAKKLFYASQPELNNKEEFNLNCRFPEQTFVIGCYDGDRIYILDIQVEELEPAEPVTAAHEMLHAAWARMTAREKSRIGDILNREYNQSDNDHLKAIIDKYRQAGNGPDIITNELHSIIPTEIEEISDELEEYYEKYFHDRTKIVELYQSYEGVFAENERTIRQLKRQIDGLYQDIHTQQRLLESRKRTIDANNARLEQLRTGGNVSEFNLLVTQQRALINEYNSLVSTYNRNIDLYEEKTEQYQALSIHHTELVRAIDSKAPIIE